MKVNENIIYLKQEVEKIRNFFLAKKFDIVIEKSKKLLKKNSNQSILYNLLGLSYYQLNQTENAINIYLSAIKQMPNDSSIYCNLGLVYQKIEDFNKARKFFLLALDKNPNHFQSYINLGNLENSLNNTKKALNFYLKAYNINSNLEEILTSLILCYSANGYFDDAKKIILELNKKFPSNTKSYQLYSKIHKYEIGDMHQKLMLEKIKKHNFDNENLSNLYFALSKSYFDQKNIQLSAEYTAKANETKFKTFKNYNFETEENVFINIKKYFKDFNFEKNILNTGEKLIFIVGLPRSGTTLLHQIISSHSNVYGAEESPFFNNFILQKFKDNNSYDLFFKRDALDKDILQRLSNEILAKYGMYDQNKIIVDKMPFNFKWIGFIKLLFPKAKVIHSNRNVAESSFSIYRNLFDSPLSWTYNQKYLVKYVNNYKQLMNFWINKLDDFIYDYRYEDLVENQIEETKKILNFCNLDFEINCIDFTKNKLPSKTVSVAQVRQKIYKDSLRFSDNYLDFFPFLKEL